jgi:hypothetical protein
MAMKSVELQHYTDGLRTSRIICHDDAVDEAMCSLISDVVGDWYRSMDHSMNPAFLPVSGDLVSTLRGGYSRSAIIGWVSRHRAWMPSLMIVDVGPCEVSPGQAERLVALAEEMSLHSA